MASANAARASRRRPLMAPADSISPSSTDRWNCAAVNTVPPVLPSRWRNSSAVRLRFRAASGTGPVTVTVCPPPSAVSVAGALAVRWQVKVTGVSRCSRLSTSCRTWANQSSGHRAFSLRVPSISGPFSPRK